MKGSSISQCFNCRCGQWDGREPTSLTVTVQVGKLSVWLAATGMLDNDRAINDVNHGGLSKNLQSRVQAAIDEGAWGGERRLSGGVVLLVESKDDLVTDIGKLERSSEQRQRKRDWGTEDLQLPRECK